MRPRCTHAAFSGDGRRVVTASHDQTARVWDAAPCQSRCPPLKHDDRVYHAEFSGDGRRVVTASEDKARVWDATTGEPLSPPLNHGNSGITPRSAATAAASSPPADNTVRVWDAATGQPLSPPLKHEATVRHAEFSADGRRVVTASADSTARVWDATTGQPIGPPLKHEGTVRHAEFSGDGRRIVTASWDKTARVWDATTGQPLGLPLKHEHAVYHAEFSGDGRRVVTASGDHTAQVWDATTGQPIGPPLKHDDRVYHAEFSGDGRRVVTASVDNTARVWDATTGEPLSPPLNHGNSVYHAAFSGDGHRVVTASSDHTARVWDATTGQPLGPPLKHEGTVWHAEFSGDGRRIVTASWDKTARVWDATTGQSLGLPLKHEHDVYHAEFSGDGRRVVTTSEDHTARVWDLANLDDNRQAADWIQLAQLYGRAKIDSHGRVVPLTAEAFRGLWQSVREKFPEYLVASSRETLAWHRHEAEDSEKEETWSSALTHLDAMLESEPDHGRLHARKALVLRKLGRWEEALSASSRAVTLDSWDWRAWDQRGTDHAELGLWAEARADFAKVFELDETQRFAILRLAMIELASNNLAGYRHACAKLITLYDSSYDLKSVDAVGWTCALGANAVADQDAMSKLVAKLVPEGPEHPIYLQTVGAANYRAGQFEDAASRLNEGIQGQQKLSASTKSPKPVANPKTAEGNAFDWLFLAMAHHRMGHLDEAKAFHDKATRWLAASTRDKPVDETFGPRILWQNWLELQVLSREAEALLDGEKAAKP